MLTFFEYLRQRAFESVVNGVQDALDSLENEPYSSQLSATANQPNRRAPANLPGQVTENEDAGEKQFSLVSTQSDALPPPRRRGRPRKSDQPS